VVYIPQGEEFIAVEAVTNANDGFNLMRDGVEGHGVFVVEPGATQSAEFSLVAKVH
jgi:aldose 1-epimerase